MNKLDIEDVFVLSGMYKRTSLHVDMTSPPEIDPRALVLGTLAPKQPFVFEHHSGSRPYDIVTTTYAVIELCSDHMLEALRGFTGWSTFPVRVHGKDGAEVPGYSGLVITGRCGPEDPDKGEAVWGAAKCEPGKPMPYRVYPWFDVGTWDGSDLFAPEGTARKLITRRLMDALKRAKLTNVDITPLSEV